jgi:hypothetical protein
MIALAPLLLIMQSIPPTFYNRPGAGPGDQAAALARCRTIATGTTEVGRPLDTAPIGGEPAGRTPDDIESCMALRGWRLYAIGPALRRRLAAMPPARAAAMLDALAGAERPLGSRLLRDGVRLRRR